MVQGQFFGTVTLSAEGGPRSVMVTAHFIGVTDISRSVLVV